MSNIITNVFIIYALRKLGKLGNTSFWFIYFLSISDCFVGLSGFAFDVLYVIMKTGHSGNWMSYVMALRSFFIGYSGRLTTIIAIDRSIRMKFLCKYNTIMTRTKACLVLMINALLGVIHTAGTFGSMAVTFEWVYLIFHLICVVSGCLLYVYTYCNIKQQVTDLNLNLGRNHSVLVHDTSMRLQPSNHENRGIVEGNVQAYDERIASECFTTSYFQKRHLERYDGAAVGKNSAITNTCINEIPERSMACNLSINYDYGKRLPKGNCKKTGFDGNHNIVIQSGDVHCTANTSKKSSNGMIHRKRNDNDIGRAMLFITITMVLFYVPIFVKGFLEFHQVRNYVLGVISIILLLANSSCNAIILTVFSREIRNLAKCLC